MTAKFAIFHDKGYNITDGIAYWLDNKFQGDWLLDYVGKDLSALPGLLEDFVSKKLDLETLDIKYYRYSSADCAKLRKLFESLHPFYEHNRRALEDTIIEYFGYLSLKTGVALKLDKNWEHPNWLENAAEWYEERIRALIDFPFPTDPDEMIQDDDCDEMITFGRVISRNMYDWFFMKTDHIKLNSKHAKPESYIGEFVTQDMVRRLLYWTLDADAPGLNRLSASQRANIYTYYFDSIGQQGKHSFSVTKESTFGKFNDSYVFDKKYNGDLLNNVHLTENLTDETANELMKLAADAKGLPREGYSERFRINSLRQLLLLEIHMMINEDTVIKQCKNCDKYFVAPGAGTKAGYCGRIAPGEETKTCKDVGPDRTFAKVLEKDKLLKMYRREYQKRYGQVRRIVEGSKKTEKKNALSDWAKETKSILEKIRANDDDAMTEQEFKEWLGREEHESRSADQKQS